MTDQDYMRLAIEMALEGIRQGQTPFGACIVKDDSIIAVAHNVVWKTTDITAHAEVNAIRIACGHLHSIDLSRATIYSTCEPCPMCFSAIHWAKIDRIVYGTSIADARECGFSELSLSNEQMKALGGSPVKVEGGFMRAECMEVFQAWLSHPNRKTY